MTMDSLQRRTDRGQSGSSGSLMRRDSDMDLFSPSTFFSASPWQIMRRMQEDMDRLFGGFLGGASNQGFGGTGSAMAPFAPNVDLSEDEKEFCLEMDLPGFRPEDVDIQVRNGQLWLRAETRQESEQGPQGQQATGQQQQAGTQANAGQQQGQQGQQQAQQQSQQQRQYHWRQRRYGVVQQAFTLPENVDEENIRAEFNHGVLMLHLPKREDRSMQGRRIPVGGSSQTEQRQIGSSEATGARSTAGAGTEAGSSGSASGGGANPQQQRQETSQKSSGQKSSG